MNLSQIKPAKGATKSSKRIGRGEGSGKGGTATKGHKGYKSRSGAPKKFGFEGGQMPLYRRVPKFGFKNPFRVAYKAVNLDELQELATNKGITDITLEVLQDSGLANKNDLIKVLGRGELKSKINIQANKFSKSAVEQIEKLGGTFSAI